MADSVEERGICEDREYLEGYDPDASPAIATECPGCRGVIVIFPSGTVAQPRQGPYLPGVMPASLLDAAFEVHYCPARPGLFACKHCGDRYDDEEAAGLCCDGPFEQHPEYVRVKGADPMEDGNE